MTDLTWNDRYASPDYLFGTEPNRWLVRQAPCLAPQSRVLCVADGEGRNSVWLAEQGHMVDAFDPAAAAVAKARKLAAQRAVTVHWTEADVDGFAWPADRYDAVVAIFVQFAPPDLRRRLFRTMAGALKPGGRLLLLGYTPAQLKFGTGGPKDVVQLYTPEQLEAELGPWLSIELIDEHEEVLSEGRGHDGHSALVGLVARRTA
jgi:SAM-dependent methyltransferase